MMPVCNTKVHFDSHSQHNSVHTTVTVVQSELCRVQLIFQYSTIQYSHCTILLYSIILSFAWTVETTVSLGLIKPTEFGLKNAKNFAFNIYDVLYS